MLDADADADGSRSYRVALRIIEAIAGMEQPVRLDDLVTAIGLSKARTYRALRSLQEGGYVDHIGRSGYRIGARALALAAMIGPRPIFVQRTYPVLNHLARTVGETASLHLRSGRHRVLVAAHFGSNSPDRREPRIGERTPLISGSGGLAILANLDPRRIDKILSTESAAVRDRIMMRLAKARADGYATSFEENYAGVSAIASPLNDPDAGHALGSIAISGNSARLTPEVLERFALPLARATRDLAPKVAKVLGPNSTARAEALNLTQAGF